MIYVIERIPAHYVSDECAQITLPFYNNITVFGENVYDIGVLCHYNLKDDSQNINKYFLDDRRLGFPYSNIPIYKGLFGKYCINQLFEYNKHYLSITNGYLRDRYLVKDGSTAVMLNRPLSIPVNITGKICSKEEIRMCLNNYNSYLLYDKYGRQYIFEGNSFRNIDKFIDNGGGLFILKDKNNNINIKLVKIHVYVGCDIYVYEEYYVALNYYTIEELRCFSSKIRDVKKYFVHSCINPNIDKNEIKANKILVRKLSNK